MKRLWRSRFGRFVLVFGATALALLALVGSASAQVALPAAVSDQGDQIRTLFFVVFGIGIFVFVLVEAMITPGCSICPGRPKPGSWPRG